MADTQSARKENVYESNKQRDEFIGRIMFAGASLILIVWMLIVKGDLASYFIFAGLSLFIGLLNALMSYVLRKKYKDIAEKPFEVLVNDRDYGPAMFARAVTLFLSVGGAVVLTWLASGSGFFLPSFVFLVIGYIYFTMIQFKRL